MDVIISITLLCRRYNLCIFFYIYLSSKFLWK